MIARAPFAQFGATLGNRLSATNAHFNRAAARVVSEHSHAAVVFLSEIEHQMRLARYFHKPSFTRAYLHIHGLNERLRALYSSRLRHYANGKNVLSYTGILHFLLLAFRRLHVYRQIYSSAAFPQLFTCLRSCKPRCFPALRATAKCALATQRFYCLCFA